MRGRSWAGGRVWGLWAVVLAGCTYVTQKEFEQKRDSVDQDEDGSPWAEDCDDQDKDRSPRFDEIPYDGIDNDCANGDVVDLDGDGFPGITSDEYAALDPKEAFPEALVGKPKDCLDDPAIRPEAATIHPPPNDTEIAYDGIDSDCDGGNDFDFDQDGYLARTAVVGTVTIDVPTAYAQYVSEWGYQAQEALWAPAGQTAPVPGDCNDFELEVHPNPSLPEVWYDGVDQDCDDRNDFDQDGDGFMPPTLPGGPGEPETPTQTAYEQFISVYHGGNPPWQLPAPVTLPDGRTLDAFSDCLDDPALAPTPVGGSAPIDPALVVPDATQANDIWYDGIDTNCWADNDFDQDLDGFVPDLVTVDGTEYDGQQAYADYVAAWGYADREETWGAPSGLDAPRPGDCNDEDATSYPEALELVGDQADQDCDGQPDAAAFSFAGWVWNRPGAPRAARIGDTYVIAVTASRVDLGSGGVLDNVGLALSVQLDAARTGVVPVTVQFKNGIATDPIGEVVEIARMPNNAELSGDTTPDPGAWIATTFTPAANSQTYLYARQVYENSSSGAISIGQSIANFPQTFYTPSSLGLTVNSFGEPYVMACTDDLMYALQGVDPLPTEPFLLDETLDRGPVCFVNTDPYEVGTDEIVEYTRCSATLCNSYSLALSTQLLTASNGNTGELWTKAHTHGGLQLLINGTNLLVRDRLGGLDYPAFSGQTVLSADAVLVGDEIFVAAIVSEGGENIVRLAYGAWPDLQTLDLPFVGAPVPDPVPTEVALHVDGDRLLVAVMARDREGLENQDTVGWMFLGTP